ncbi:hypothetical protein BCV69DRAFT_81315 [Microstroma glucosiphilum]|uniref:Uncharacterized protein n=1 Tax=Pseudomicrostroma glucosiphilum TaxID=1684307 RepID=A0A316TYF5_9BASI|nr:hypothetical protein BCV69DRAFT_81315 [Pseudomicrostroma glucosiphilum]PWN18306.1 hypothetical protein BCV69DRAFT_81315 [Pseudomicrostroma glucosiphilum]
MKASCLSSGVVTDKNDPEWIGAARHISAFRFSTQYGRDDGLGGRSDLRSANFHGFMCASRRWELPAGLSDSTFEQVIVGAALSVADVSHHETHRDCTLLAACGVDGTGARPISSPASLTRKNASRLTIGHITLLPCIGRIRPMGRTEARRLRTSRWVALQNGIFKEPMQLFKRLLPLRLCKRVMKDTSLWWGCFGAWIGCLRATDEEHKITSHRKGTP